MLISAAEQKRIDEFIARVRGIPELNARMTALSELNWLHNREKANGEKYSEDVNRKVITAYRDAIRAEFGEKSPLLKVMHYSKERTDEFNARSIAGRTEKHLNMRPLRASEYVAAGKELVTEVATGRWTNPGAIASVCALTGRRPFEVAITGHFEPDPDRANHIQFRGQAKTRDEERAQATYSFPVLAARDHVLEVVAELRNRFDPTMDNPTFSQRYAKEYGLKAKATFHDANGDPIKPRDLREAYAAIAVRRFAPSNVSDVQYMNAILGHKSGSLDTTLYYIGFTVI